ncbi:hypothetical protein [Deinococcus sp. UYEF24]
MTLSRWLLVPLLLTACSSSPTPEIPTLLPDPPQPTTSQRSGTVNVYSNQVNPDAPVQTGAYGRFLQLRSPVPSLPSFERPDGCSLQVVKPLAGSVSRSASTPVQVNLPAEVEPPFAHDIDAGEAISLTSITTGVTVATLPKVVYPAGDTPNFLYRDEHLEPLSSGLTVVIPGAAGGFPAVTTVLSDTPPARLLEPVNGDHLSLTGTIRWSDPTFDPAGQMRFTVPVKVEGPEDVTLFCNVIDDGSFSFAPDLVAKLTALKWVSGRITGTIRTTERVLYRGDALLLVERSASIAYPER